MSIVFIVLLGLVAVVALRVFTGQPRYEGRVGPPIWRWSEWKDHWQSRGSPLSDPF
jgi:hypothetical protein